MGFFSLQAAKVSAAMAKMNIFFIVVSQFACKVTKN
jgi:hypothetical protein